MELFEVSFAEDGFCCQMGAACVSTVQYAVLVNGNPGEPFSPSRGLRQGDSISPYLFLFCAEVLSSLLLQAESKGIISGVPTSPKGPKSSHLFFADDCIIFCKSNHVEWRRILRILGIFEEGSGQKVNLLKSFIFFSRNTSQDRRDEILRLSGLTETKRFDTYLGLPALIGKAKVQAFKKY
jgi:hypothetical protein